MLTVTCQFLFPDASVALAKVTVESPEEAGQVTYAGEFEKLPDRFKECEPSVLRIWAQRVAKQTGAELGITESGKYDSWAE